MRERAQRFDSRQEMHKSDFEIFHYNEPKPTDVEVHHHDFYEIYYFLRGGVSYWVEGKSYRMEHRDIMLINPTVLHRPVVEHGKYERIVLWVNKKFLDDLCVDGVSLSRCFTGAESTGCNLIHQRSSAIDELMAALVREYYSEGYGREQMCRGLFLQLMVTLNRLSMTAVPAGEGLQDDSPLVSGVLEYINEHYSTPLSLDGLARKFFVSKYHLSHEFARSVGIGVYRYIMLKRLSAAKQLLSEGERAGEVYLKCGFADYAGFFRAFKGEYGVSPGAFKR